ncbi:PAS domain S-box protein [Maribellus comscasis]|uniref:histidine kinase n=1 Tax=Maribellus comscasis TaxID=2681766 RepID=A0A6I6JRD5_9BACT|nr:PAS domain-containing sensor histidine kinase [Maribellus comscasis]QGY44971.1 PAS domain S-box protein [Maribellus comscasis]
MTRQNKFLHIIENFNDVIWTIDIKTGRFTYVSPSVTKLFGYTLDEALEGVFDANPNNNESYKATQQKILLEIEKLVYSGREYSDMQFEYQMPDKSGIQIWVETEVRILKEDGQPKEILGITRNIEERKRVDSILKNYANELEKLNTQKDLFLKVLAHDLRSPFHSLLGFSNHIIETFDESNPDETKEKLKLLNQNIYSTFHLLEDLLLWTKNQSGKLVSVYKNISFNDLCEDVLENVNSDSKSIQIKYFESEKIVLRTDITMLKVILRNLVENAVKFSHDGGIIKIYAIQTNENVTISVADYGVGMTEKQVDNLWQNPNSSAGTKGEKGFGLGLTFCKELVERLGGKIWVESALGKGSNFRFSLPAQIKS